MLGANWSLRTARISLNYLNYALLFRRWISATITFNCKPPRSNWLCWQLLTTWMTFARWTPSACSFCHCPRAERASARAPPAPTVSATSAGTPKVTIYNHTRAAASHSPCARLPCVQFSNVSWKFLPLEERWRWWWNAFSSFVMLMQRYLSLMHIFVALNLNALCITEFVTWPVHASWCLFVGVQDFLCEIRCDDRCFCF